MSNENVSERRRASREAAAQRPALAPPGLTAALIYLRPVSRAHLLSTLANLGVFVREYQSLPVLELWRESSECDLALLVGGNDPSHVAAADRIVSTVTPATIILVPDDEAAAAFAATGAVATVRDGEIESALVSAIGAAAQHARSRRESLRSPETVIVGEVRFSLLLGRLECNGRGVGLSGTEQKVLRRLTATPGVPVSSSELEGEVQDSGDEKSHGSELRATILRLRRKLEQVGGNPLQLGTVRGFGYVLVP